MMTMSRTGGNHDENAREDVKDDTMTLQKITSPDAMTMNDDAMMTAEQ